MGQDAPKGESMFNPSLLCLVALASESSSSPWPFAVFVFAVGVFMFGVGFRKYRKYRLIEDTPRMTVRSLPMGLVHIQGKAVGEKPLTSPLTRQPCFFYQVVIEEWTRKKEDTEDWENFRTDVGQQEFYLEDGTGKVRINQHRAEYDLNQTFRAGLGPRGQGQRFVDPTLGVAGPTEPELQAYLQQSPAQARAALGQVDAPAQEVGKEASFMGISSRGRDANFKPGGGSFRFTEKCLIAERPCNILGTCVENPQPQDEHDRNLIQKGENEPVFVISDKAERAIEKNLLRNALIMILVGAAFMVVALAVALVMPGCE